MLSLSTPNRRQFHFVRSRSRPRTARPRHQLDARIGDRAGIAKRVGMSTRCRTDSRRVGLAPRFDRNEEPPKPIGYYTNSRPEKRSTSPSYSTHARDRGSIDSSSRRLKKGACRTSRAQHSRGATRINARHAISADVKTFSSRESTPELEREKNSRPLATPATEFSTRIEFAADL